jgi:hypothetical protein
MDNFGSGAHQTSYTMCTGGKAAGAWRWSLTSIWWWRQELWSYTSNRPYVFMAWCLIKYKTTLSLPYWTLLVRSAMWTLRYYSTFRRSSPPPSSGVEVGYQLHTQKAYWPIRLHRIQLSCKLRIIQVPEGLTVAELIEMYQVRRHNPWKLGKDSFSVWRISCCNHWTPSLIYIGQKGSNVTETACIFYK